MANVSTCADHPHHACRCTDVDRERSKSMREALLTAPAPVCPLCRLPLVQEGAYWVCTAHGWFTAAEAAASTRPCAHNTTARVCYYCFAEVRSQRDAMLAGFDKLREELAAQRAAVLEEAALAADRIRAQIVPCQDHPMPLPKPSCWKCGRNGAFERAARVVEDFARLDAGVIT